MDDRRGPARVRFWKGSPRWSDLRHLGLPAVAVGGRSNVGKSSLINALVGRRRLARTSSTPGRTQMVNLFVLDERLVLADLPGHGYARAPKDLVRRWTENTRRFLEGCEDLRGVVLLVDARRDPTADDLGFARAVHRAGLPLVVAVTKVDKVARGSRRRRLDAIGRALQVDPAGLVPTSARTGEGRDALWQAVLALVDGVEADG